MPLEPGASHEVSRTVTPDVWDAKEKIAEGRHERVVVPNLEKFLERTMKKGQA